MNCPNGHKLPGIQRLPFVLKHCPTCGWKQERRTWSEIKAGWQRRK